jgi:hypothetical protein
VAMRYFLQNELKTQKSKIFALFGAQNEDFSPQNGQNIQYKKFNLIEKLARKSIFYWVH